MNSRKKITVQLDALSIYYYLLKYSNLENEIKQLYIKYWPDFDEIFKQRLMYYQGGVNSEDRYIEYDTYSVVVQHNKFDVIKMLNKLTLNQIIKLERKDNQIKDLQYEILSLQNKRLVYPCQDCILKLINMRNILAHKMNTLNFANKDYIDILSNKIIGSSNLEWLSDYDLNLLSEAARCIVSNYIYMDIIYQRLRGNQNVETVDKG